MANRWSPTNVDGKYPVARINSYDINFASSSANFFDTSFIRLKNVGLAYDFPAKPLKALKVKGLRLAADAQNLFTFWNDQLLLMDPESGTLTAGLSRNMPPLKTLVLSAQFNF